MKRYLLYSLMTAALLGSCSRETSREHPLPDGQPVRFVSEVGTRGVNMTSARIREFSVFCYDLKGTSWDPAASVPNKMNDLKVERLGTANEWTYGEPISWDGGDGRRFSFLGYSPWATGMGTTGNLLEVVTPVAGIPTLNYRTASSLADQVDLLVARPLISIVPAEYVNMRFSHALVRVRIEVYSDTPGTVIRSVTLSGLKYKGSVSLDAAHVWTVENDTQDYKLELNPELPVSTNSAAPTDATGNDNYFIVLPQGDLAANTTALLSIEFSRPNETVPVKSYTLVENYTPGKSITYLVDLSGAPTEELLVDQVTVEDWALADAEDLNTGSGTVSKK